MDRKPLPETIPWNLRDGIEMYIDEHRPAGHFLTAVFENNLTQAINRADPESLAALKPLVVYLFTEAPGYCWGNEASVREWVGMDKSMCEHCMEREAAPEARPTHCPTCGHRGDCPDCEAQWARKREAPEGSHSATWMGQQMPEIDFEREEGSDV